MSSISGISVLCINGVMIGIKNGVFDGYWVL